VIPLAGEAASLEAFIRFRPRYAVSEKYKKTKYGG
jgi:hypothetical protein